MTDRHDVAIKAVRYYFLSGALEAAIGAVLIVLIPADPKNAWLLGLSRSRWAFLSGMLIIGVLFAALWVRSRRNPGWLTRLGRWLATLATRYRYSLPIMLALGLGVLFWPYFYLVIVHANLTTLYGILIRLAPFVFLILVRGIQALAVLWYLNARSPREAGDRHPDEPLAIQPRKVAVLFIGFASLIVLASIGLDVIKHLTWDQKFLGFRVKFDLDQEANVPTFFSTMLLLFNCALFGFIAAARRRGRDAYACYWASLSLGFLFLALDEAAVLHEKLIEPLRNLFNASGIFYFAWVIFAIPIVLLLGLIYIRFLKYLPKSTMIGIVLGAGVYLSGTLGFELVGGWYANNYNENGPMFDVLTTIEETLEMAGLILLAYTLLSYLRDHIQELKLRFV